MSEQNYSPEQLAIHSFADEYDIDLSDCDSFEDELDVVQKFVEEHDSLSGDTEIEFSVNLDLRFARTVEDLTFGSWWDHQSKRIQRNIADDGFTPREIQDVEFQEAWDSNDL